MITGAIVTAFLAGLSALVSLFPAVNLPTPTTADTTLSIVYDFDQIVPVATIVAALLACLGIALALVVWDLVVWVYHQFWGND